MNSEVPLPELIPPLPPTRPSWTRIFIGPNGLRAGWRLLIYLCLFYAVGFVLGEVVRHLPALRQLVRGGTPGELSPGPLLVQEMVSALMALVPALILGKFERRSLGDYGIPLRGAFGIRFWQGMVWGLADVTVLVLLIRTFHGYSFGELALHGETVWRYALLWAAVFLVVGLFEEFAFRGYTQFTLATGIGFWPAAVLLSAGFGAIHLANPGEAVVGGLSVFVIAMFFCLTLRRTGSLWFAIGMHASFDWGETFLYSVPDSGFLAKGHLLNSSFHGPRWLTGGTIGPEGSAMAFLTMFLLFMVFNWLYPAKKTI